VNRQQGIEGGLSGYRALDLTDSRGFLCGKILADLGADVIKVEPPGGDPSRSLGPFYHDEPDPERSLLWWAYNTSKRGITLDLTTQEGRTAFLELVRKADFVIESFTPGRMAELGLGYEDLSAANPGLIMVSISGFGQEGPYARHRAPDIVCTAMAGYMNLVGKTDRPPLRISLPQAYLHASNDAATGALMALWHRKKTGVGQWVDVSAQECMAWECFSNHVYLTLRGVVPARADAGNASLTPGQPPLPVLFPCKDGHVLFTPAIGVQGAKSREFVAWMDAEGMANDLLRGFDWDTSAAAVGELPEEEREQFRQDLRARLLAARESFLPFLMTKTREELFQQAVARAFLLAPVYRAHDALTNRHFIARGFWQMVRHPELDETFPYPGAPFVAGGIPYRIRRRAPLIGEHNDEVLGEEAVASAHIPDGPSGDEIFEGLKVVDMTWVTVGPRALRYFADHGATVIKIEAPERPDIGRAVPPFKDELPGPDRSGWFALYNANKLATTIDLTRPEGVGLARRLIQWADVLVESFRPGVMKKMGLDYDSVRDLNPGLVYVSTSQLGQTGPHSQFGGYGHHAAAMTGFDDLTGWPDRTPSGVFWAYTDHIAPQYLVDAVIVALLQRRRTGRGQYIDQSQNESALQFLAPAFLDYAINGRITTRNGNRDRYTSPHGAFRCQGEDRWCVIAVETDRDWQALCHVMGRHDLVKDTRFATLTAAKEHEDELERIVEAWTLGMSAEMVMSRLQQAGVAAGIVANAEDVHCDPQLRLRKHFLRFDHPVIGLHDVDALPPRFSRTPARAYRREPCLGEHNAYVCTEIMGMSDEEFVRLLQEGVFGQV